MVPRLAASLFQLKKKNNYYGTDRTKKPEPI